MVEHLEPEETKIRENSNGKLETGVKGKTVFWKRQ